MWALVTKAGVFERSLISAIAITFDSQYRIYLLSNYIRILISHIGLTTSQLCLRSFDLGAALSFYPRDAVLARVFATATCLSVRQEPRRKL